MTKHDGFYGMNCSMGDKRLCAFDTYVINHEADQADQLRNASLVMFISAGVLVAGGVVLYVFTPKPRAPDTAQPPAQTGRVGCTLAGAGLACAGTF